MCLHLFGSQCHVEHAVTEKKIKKKAPKRPIMLNPLAETFAQLFDNNDVTFALQLKSTTGCTRCPQCPLVQPKALTATKSEEPKIRGKPTKPAAEEKDKSEKVFLREESDSEPESDEVEYRSQQLEEGMKSRGYRKRIPKCSLDVANQTARVWEEQKGNCKSCQEPLTQYAQFGKASNFRFRLHDYRQCPSEDNIVGLLCTVCANCFDTVMNQESEWIIIRNLMFRRSVAISSVSYLSKLPENQTEGFSKMRLGISGAELKKKWAEQGGLSAFRVTPEILAEFDRPTRDKIFADMKRYDEEKLKPSKPSSLPPCWKNPYYLVFQVPLCVQQTLLFAPKVFPKIKRGQSADVHTSLICNLFFGMMGDLRVSEFLSWAKKHIHQAPLLRSLRGKPFQRFPLPDLSPELPETTEFDTKYREYAEAKLEIKKRMAELKQLRVASKALFETIHAPLWNHLRETHSKSKTLSDLGVTMGFTSRVGRKRTVNEAFLAEKMPSLFREEVPLPNFSLADWENVCSRVLTKCYSTEFRGVAPMVWDIGVKKQKK
jgi:hypothetical protein